MITILNVYGTRYAAIGELRIRIDNADPAASLRQYAAAERAKAEACLRRAERVEAELAKDAAA